MALFESALSIISDAAVECGLGSVSAVYASTDANVVQMRTLLKSLGRRLARKRRWTQLTREHTFVTDSGTTSYTLPTDFLSMVDDSPWNRTSDERAHHVSPGEWQALKATETATTFDTLYRISNSTTMVLHDPPSGETVAYEYRSRYWVAPTGSTTPTRDVPEADTDVVLFDAVMMVSGIALAWKKAKGLDVTAAIDEFLETYGLVEDAQRGAAPVLDLIGHRTGPRFLDGRNAPDTGYGFDGFGGLF